MTYVHTSSPRAAGLNEAQKEALEALEKRGPGALSDWDRGQLAAIRMFGQEHETQRVDRLVQDAAKLEARRANKRRERADDDTGESLLIGHYDAYGVYRR